MRWQGEGHAVQRAVLGELALIVIAPGAKGGGMCSMFTDPIVERSISLPERRGAVQHILCDAGVNWSDLTVLTEAGVNWSDIDVLSDTGINWSDIGVMSEA